MIKIKEKIFNKNKLPICSDYDSDCKFIDSPLACFIGGFNLIKNDNLYLPMADGICPLMKIKEN